MAASPTEESFSDDGRSQSPLPDRRQPASKRKANNLTGQDALPTAATLPSAEDWIRETNNPQTPERSANLTKLDDALRAYEAVGLQFRASLQKYNRAMAEHDRAQEASNRPSMSGEEKLDADAKFFDAKKTAAQCAIDLGNSFATLNQAFTRVAASYENWRGLWSRFKGSLTGRVSARDAQGKESELKEAIKSGRPRMKKAAKIYENLAQESTGRLDHMNSLSPISASSPVVFGGGALPPGTSREGNRLSSASTVGGGDVLLFDTQPRRGASPGSSEGAEDSPDELLNLGVYRSSRALSPLNLRESWPPGGGRQSLDAAAERFEASRQAEVSGGRPGGDSTGPATPPTGGSLDRYVGRAMLAKKAREPESPPPPVPALPNLSGSAPLGPRAIPPASRDASVAQDSQHPQQRPYHADSTESLGSHHSGREQQQHQEQTASASEPPRRANSPTRDYPEEGRRSNDSQRIIRR